jgi:hypothetical protein
MLEKQIIELPFFQGLETKSDAKQIPLGKLLVCQNAVFTAPGKLQKRNGYTALTTNILGGGTISTGAALFTRANELCMTDTSRNLYSYDASNTAWHNVGKMPSVTVTSTPLASNQYSMRNLDLAIAPNGLQCCVFEMQDLNATSSQQQSVGYSVIDTTTGQTVVPPTTMSSPTAGSFAMLPRVAILGTTFLIYWTEGDFATVQVINVATLDSTSPTTAVSGGNLTSGAAASAQAFASVNYDVVVNTDVYVVFNNRSGGTTVFRCLAASPTAVSSSANIAATASTLNCIFADGTNVVIGFNTSATVMKEAVYSSTLSVVKSPTTIDTVTDAWRSVTGVATATNTIQFYMGVAGASNDLLQYTRTVAVTTASYTPGTATTLIRSLQPAAKACALSGASYLPAWFSTSIGTTYYTPQNTIFLLDSTGNVLGKALAGTSGGFNTTGTAATSGIYTTLVNLSSSYVSSNSITFPATSSTRILAFVRRGVTPSAYQFAAVGLTFNLSDTTNNYLRGQLANAVHTSGAALQMYDGQNVVEHGFFIYPFGITGVASVGGSLTPSSNYSYKVVYEWTDAYGQVHRSAPGTIIGSTAIGLNDKITLTIPTLRVTAKGASKILIQVYRTAANGTVYYQISNFGLAGSLYNSSGVNSVTWVDTQSDTAIASNPQLYTTGGVYSNEQCPPCGPMTVHRNRLCVVDSTNPTTIWFSQLVSPPAPVEFSSFLTMNIDPKGGPITALASLDDKLIIFKSDRIFMVLGQGPDSTGNQNDFTDAMLVSADTGCAVPKSVVVVPDGIMFQSPKGIYLLNRALQVSYIGAPVEAYNAYAVCAATLTPITNQVRFGIVSSNGGSGPFALVYDHIVGQWSTFRDEEGDTIQDACVWRGINMVLPAAGNPAGVATTAWQESIVFTDLDASIVSLDVETGWIKLSGLQGFQRVWRAMVLGEFKGAHTLGLQFVYDYNTTPSQITSFVVAADASPYQYRVHLATQKCEAIRVIIADRSQGGTGEALTLSGLAFEVGIKRGTRKLPAGQSG